MKASFLPERWTMFIKTLCLLSNFKCLLEFRNTTDPIGLEGLKLYTWLSIFLHGCFPLLRNASRRAFPTSRKCVREVIPSPGRKMEHLLRQGLYFWEEHTWAHPESPLSWLGDCYTALKHVLNKVFKILRSCLLKFTIISSWNSFVLGLCRLPMPHQQLS